MRVLVHGFEHPAFAAMSRKFNEEASNLGIELKNVGTPEAGAHELAIAVGRRASRLVTPGAPEAGAGSPGAGPREWLSAGKFRRIVGEFKPDFVVTDQQGYFGLAAIKEGIPLLMHLRGDYWREEERAIARIPSRKLFRRFAMSRRMKNADECFRRSSLIMPISRHLDGIVRARFPRKPTAVMHHGIDPEAWRSGEEGGGVDVKHPCVGLVQNANILEKAAEMPVLSRVMAALPHVTFYWAGDGPHRDAVLPELSRHDNFVWLGNLDPPGVRGFLSSVDVYGLASGLDMLPATVLEAQMARRPVVATRVGGVPEAIVEGRTGLLADRGDHARWVEHVEALLGDEKMRRRMGAEGRRFVEENFTAKAMARQFRNAIGKAA